MKTGGTFCRFSVGSSRSGASVRHLRYVARPEAARETLLWNLPLSVTGPGRSDLDSLEQTSADYAALTARLQAYAQAQEQREITGHHSRGKPRTHYRTLLSFEADPGSERAQSMVLSWLEAVFPRARAAAFFHRNTAHLHAHVWIAARQTDGRKVNLDAQAFRIIDETWNHEYAAALGIPEHEHLHKKWQTEGYKSLRRVGERAERPARVAHDWDPSLFTERERQRLGAYDPALSNSSLSNPDLHTPKSEVGTKSEVGKLHIAEVGNRTPMEAAEKDSYQRGQEEVKNYERVESGTAENQSTTSRGADAAARPQSKSPAEADAVRSTLREAQRALSEARRLHAAADSVHAAAAHLAQQGRRPDAERGQDLAPEVDSGGQKLSELFVDAADQGRER